MDIKKAVNNAEQCAALWRMGMGALRDACAESTQAAVARKLKEY